MTTTEWLAQMRALVAEATPRGWALDSRTVEAVARLKLADARYVLAVNPTVLARLCDVVEAAEKRERVHQDTDNDLMGAVARGMANAEVMRAIRALGEGEEATEVYRRNYDAECVTSQPHRFTVPVEWANRGTGTNTRVLRLQCETCDEQREVKHA